MKTPLTVWLKDYRMKSHTSLLSPHYVRDEFNPTEKTPDLSFASVVNFVRMRFILYSHCPRRCPPGSS